MTIRDIGILFGYKVDESSERKVEGSIKSLKSMASKVLGAVGITLSVAGIKSAVDGCVEVASSVEEMQNKFDVVFGDMRDEVNKWAQEYSDAIGRNKNDIKTYLADQQNLLVGFGMTRQAGAEMAEQMTSLALDLASFGNMDETASVNAMTKAVMGESEAAKTLGAVLNDSTRAQAMATLGLKGTYDKLDQLTKMQVNYQAILQQSPDAIGDCQRSLDSYESTKKRYIAKLKEIKTIVGQFFLPTYQKILSIGAKGLTMIRDWLQKLTELTDKLGGSQRVLAILTAALTAMLVAMNLKKIGAAITGFTKLARAIGLGHGKALAFFAVFLLLALVIEDFISFMRGDKSLLGTMLERAGVDCEKLRQNIVGVWTKIKQAIGYIGEGIRDVVVPIFEGIRTAAVVAFEEIQQAVAKVAPGIAQFFKELSSGKVDKKKWTDIGESIGRIAVGVVAVIAAVKGISAIFGVITTVISVVKAVISVIKLAFVVVKSIITVIKVVGAVISVLASAFGPVILAIAAAIAIGVLLWKNWDKIREAAGNLLEGIKTTIGNVRDAIVSGFQAAIDWITSLPAEALKWGSDIIDGIVSGIQSAVGRVGEAVKGVADKIKSFLGFSEPEDGPLSDFHTYMPDMIDLMASGITSGKKKVKDALEGMTGEMSVIAKANVVSKATGRGATGRTTGGRTVTQNVNINNQFNGDRAGQQKSSEAMDKAAGDATGEMARALAFAK
jgi:phage-related protein|nr:MAG TPA_asm: tail tape measure protein [Caudoviricetes sp.]